MWDGWRTFAKQFLGSLFYQCKSKKGKVVPLRSIEAHLGDRVRYSSYSFITWAPEGAEWSASRPGRALPPGKEPPVPTVQEAGWAPEPVWTKRFEEKSSASVRDRTPAVQSVARHYTDWGTRLLFYRCIVYYCNTLYIAMTRDMSPNVKRFRTQPHPEERLLCWINARTQTGAVKNRQGHVNRNHTPVVAAAETVPDCVTRYDSWWRQWHGFQPALSLCKLLRNTHCRLQKSSLLITKLSELSPVDLRTLIHYPFNIILPSTNRFFKASLPLRHSDCNHVCIYYLLQSSAETLTMVRRQVLTCIFTLPIVYNSIKLQRSGSWVSFRLSLKMARTETVPVGPPVWTSLRPQRS
jgi:hypothetical protein